MLLTLSKNEVGKDEFVLYTMPNEGRMAAKAGFRRRDGMYRSENWSLAKRLSFFADSQTKPILDSWEPPCNDFNQYVPIALPGGDRKLFKHQIEAVRFCLSHKRSMLALSMGLGKSYTSLHWLKSLAYAKQANRCVIVVPACLKKDWVSNVLFWLGINAHVVDKNTVFEGSGVYIINYARLKKHKHQILNWNPDALIIDEGHMIKNPTSQRGKICRELIESTEWVMLMTGTPFPNSIQESFNLFNVLDPLRFPSYLMHEDFVRQYGKDVMYRKTMDDVFDMPEKVLEYIKIDSKGNVIELFDEIESYSIEHDVVEHIEFERFSRARRESSRKKLNIMKKHAQLALDKIGDAPLLLFGYHTEIIDEMYEYLVEKGYKTSKYHGKMRASDKESHKTAFENGESQIMIASIRSAGVGLNFQHCSNALFLELDYSPYQIEQCIHRIYRHGSEKTVYIRFLVEEGSFDERMLKCLEKKQKHVNDVVVQTNL